MTTHLPRPTPTRRAVLSMLGLGVLGLAGCAASSGTDSTATSPGSSGTSSTGASSAGASAGRGTGIFAADVIHTVTAAAAASVFTGALATFKSSGTKEWIDVEVTLDGTTFQHVGMRLKGNSSLRSVAAGTAPQLLPWLVKLDKFVKGQAHEGVSEFVVRSNSSATALNEAVALDLLAASGLSAQRAAYIALSVNDSAPALRLIVENPGDEWVDRVFNADGKLYKAEATGDYTYRGSDPAAYDEVFDQEAGDKDLTPLMGFLQFVNDSSDADFVAGLADRLDTAAFARYLAFETLVDNFDDIDGPGNNSYLWWDADTTKMTVVAWDHNLAFGLRPNGGGARGGGAVPGGVPNGAVPEGAVPGGAVPGGAVPDGAVIDGAVPGGGAPPGGGIGGPQGGGRGPNGKVNPLVTRFTAQAQWQQAVTAAKTELTTTLVTSGAGATALARWQALLSGDSRGLVPAATITTEAAAITTKLSAT